MFCIFSIIELTSFSSHTFSLPLWKTFFFTFFSVTIIIPFFFKHTFLFGSLASLLYFYKIHLYNVFPSMTCNFICSSKKQPIWIVIFIKTKVVSSNLLARIFCALFSRSSYFLLIFNTLFAGSTFSSFFFFFFKCFLK